MSPRYWLYIGVLVWLAAAFGVLQLGLMTGDFGHAACGPWGCFPPLQALAAMHLLWFLLLTPLAVWAVVKWSTRSLWLLGIGLVASGVLGIGIVAGREMLYWLPIVADVYRRYLGQRILARVVMLSDVPLVQSVVVGLVCWRVAVRRSKRGPSSSEAETCVGESASVQSLGLTARDEVPATQGD